MVANINITVSSQSLTKLYCLLVVYTAVNLITTYSVICLLFLLDLLLYSSLTITANKVERLLVIATHTNTHENKQTHASSYKNTYINLYAYTNTHPHSQTHTEKTQTPTKSHTHKPQAKSTMYEVLVAVLHLLILLREFTLNCCPYCIIWGRLSRLQEESPL